MRDGLRRRHSMPFGSEIEDDGTVRFGLWAPGATKVELCLAGPLGSERFLTMVRQQDDRYLLEKVEAALGSHYRFRIDGELLVPDPASRCQAVDVHGWSVVIDPQSFIWRDGAWSGRPWEEAVIYELHVGAFTAGGDFAGVAERLDYLVDLGITALELMPIADFPGQRNWGYDGVLLFAPARRYGTPEQLKSLIQEAHVRNLMVYLDVVYNHFGPDGNYLYTYARDAFFNHAKQTPWGDAVNFDGPQSRVVRDFFIHNALYWLEEYNVDGLRFDAVHAIYDQSRPHFLEELAVAVRQGPAQRRHIHLILENDGNEAHYLERNRDSSPRYYTAQWNDDFHHACHVFLTGEQDGYYQDYTDDPLHHLGRCLTEGFAYQGEPSAYRQQRPRGERSAHLPLTAFVSFLQNHDQVGNRALGERLRELAPGSCLEMITSLLLLSPSPPLLFMGEESAARQPFLFFCNFSGELARQVTMGRREEFSRFRRFADPRDRLTIPDPNDPATFMRSKLNWQQPLDQTASSTLQRYQHLLALRGREIVPRLSGLSGHAGRYSCPGTGSLQVTWRLGDGAVLLMIMNCSDQPLADVISSWSSLLYVWPEMSPEDMAHNLLPPNSIVWFLLEREEQ